MIKGMNFKEVGKPGSMELATEIRITRRKLKTMGNDAIKTAEAVNLRYVNDSEPGIERVKTEKGFKYVLNGKEITDVEVLGRIKSLVLPPAWSKVWICADDNGHLQATGFDVKGRKQYKYHPLWNTLRNHTKYFHLLDFGKVLPTIRIQLKKDLSLPGLPLEKVLATVVSLMQCTCIRIGNSVYEKENGSFGLTTLKDQHVKIDGQQMKFSFKGKKGIYHNISLKSKKLAKIVQACRDIPGKELFQYYDDNKERRSVDSGMVNNYIKAISGGNFTAKDFRTWAGTLRALEALKELGCCDTVSETKKKIVEALDVVATHLGNTRSICKKYYVHPAILDLYSNRSLEKYFSELDTADCTTIGEDLTSEEKVLMKILEAYGSAIIV
jgi:DNA topoisomerase I